MIPIEYRLDKESENEYIAKVLRCIENKEFYADKLRKLLEKMDKAGYSIGRKILNESKRFVSDYPDYACLCKWLILSYEELEQIKKYLDDIIKYGLEQKNMEAKRLGATIEEIKSFHDLKKRRKNKYDNLNGLKIMMMKKIAYDQIFEDFEAFSRYYKDFSKCEINSWIIEKTELKVCPYCNISYTYNRRKSVTAQLDHFFPKSEYSMFALCFYNLVPSCPACNKMKLDGIEELASPYKESAFKNLRITWNYGKVADGDKEKYEEKNSLRDLEKMIEIKIVTSDESEKSNLSKMKINEAYEQHRDYASEVIKKVKTYANHNAQKLICSITKEENITPEEIKRFYFGNYLEESDFKKRPLSKLTHDFYEEYSSLYK